MEDMLNVAEAKTRLIQELSEITGFKYLKSGVLKKTVKDIVFEINFFSSKWNESGQSIEINAELRLIYKTYGKLPVDNVVASMSYQPENGYWYDISTESRLLETRNILEKRFQETAMDLVHRFENNYHSAVQYLFFEGFEKYDVQDDLESLMEGGCKQNYELIPFASDGDGGVCVLVDNQYVAMIDSEGGAGYIAASVDDFINILLWYKYIPITKKVFDGFEEFIEDYQRDEYGSNTSELINDFLQSEHLDLDNRMVYEKFLKGVSLTPAFIIEPMDEEYEISENLFRFDEAEFNEKIRCTGFAANEGDVDMVFEDAFTDLQSEFVSLCMEYTGGCVDKIYIYIYQDASQKMFNAIFVKGDRVIPAGNFADDEASDEFLSIGTKDISKLVELCDMYQQKCPNEYKLEFDVATHKFDASYRYDDYTKSGISPVSELMSWYGEIKESM